VQERKKGMRKVRKLLRLGNGEKEINERKETKQARQKKKPRKQCTTRKLTNYASW
jgi:hypothetical protein